ncbi:hypothetical protein GGR52DRAFT_589676 [Hypoxylon sp. FL1284]|nr:hypothetical protein GGR52DRAFT_589676 [Hypoxylon sp. FL1284]
MLRRLTQRPFARLGAAAAATWPSIPRARLLFSSSSQHRQQLQSPTFGSEQFQPDNDRVADDPADDGKGDNAPAATEQPPSLFEKLFPDEAKRARAQQQQQQQQQADQVPKSAWASPTSGNDEPPPLGPPQTTSEAEHQPKDHNNDDGSSSSTTTDSSSSDALRAKSMLILSGASRQLQASDFARLGRRGAHVEGWILGLQRVVQARDPDTLRPQGHYFILFDGDAAAAAFRHEVDRRWRLAKAARRSPVRRRRHRLSRDGRKIKDADVDGFTLVPPSQRYAVRAAGAQQDRARVGGLDVGGGAAFVDRLAARAGTPHLVLVTVDGGRLAPAALRRALDDDGAARCLPWRVVDVADAPAPGILPFGKSVRVRRPDDGAGGDQMERNLRDQGGRAVGDGEGEAAGEEGEAGGGDAAAAAAAADDAEYRLYPRFVVPFADAPEAHRFVRNWHRRRLRLRANPDGDEASWDEVRTLNASILW